MSTNSSPVVSVNYALSYPGLSPDPNTPHKGIMGPTAAAPQHGRSTGAPFTAQTTGTNYLSFLLNIQSLPPTGPNNARPVIGELESATATSANGSSGVTVWVTPTGQLQFDVHNSTTPLTNTTSPLTPGNTYFIVLAYVFSNNMTQIGGKWICGSIRPPWATTPTSRPRPSSPPTPTLTMCMAALCPLHPH